MRSDMPFEVICLCERTFTDVTLTDLALSSSPSRWSGAGFSGGACLWHHSAAMDQLLLGTLAQL